MGDRGGGRKCVVSFDVHHRPHREARRGQGLFDQIELAPKQRIDTTPVLVGVQHVVAKRLDHVIGGHPYVGCAFLDQLQTSADHASRRRHLTAIGGEVGRHGVVVTEQLIGAVDQMYLHGCSSDQEASV